MLIGLSIIGACFGKDALAQITPDGSTNSPLITDTINGAPATRINGGVQQGNNLFHSFSQFNINLGQRVYFTDPGVNNILSRVTGNNPSIIQGLLGVDGAANLFLLNPKGIIFGPNSSLDVRGSFVGTANALEFGTQGIFSTTPTAVPLLTVNPSAFLSNQIAAASITNQSTAGLQVPNGKSLLLVGGDVRLECGVLRAPGGRIELGGLTETGRVQIDGDNLKLTFPDHIGRGDITITNSSIVDVVAGGGCGILLNGGSISLNNSQLQVQSSSTNGDSGIISLKALGGAISANNSIISSDIRAGATGNAIDVIDPSRLIAQRCALRSRASPNQENKFTVTQRGRLLPNPTEMLQNESVVTNWVTLNTPEKKPVGTTSAMPAVTSVSKSAQYIEAQGWVIDNKGEVVLTAQSPTATPHNPTQISGFSCNGS